MPQMASAAKYSSRITLFSSEVRLGFSTISNIAANLLSTMFRRLLRSQYSKHLPINLVLAEDAVKGRVGAVRRSDRDGRAGGGPARPSLPGGAGRLRTRRWRRGRSPAGLRQAS